jgi:putative lipoprotein
MIDTDNRPPLPPMAGTGVVFEPSPSMGEGWEGVIVPGCDGITPTPALPHRGGGSRREGRMMPLLVLLIVTLALAGCGKKGAPQPPPDEPNTYPRVYPSG